MFVFLRKSLCFLLFEEKENLKTKTRSSTPTDDAFFNLTGLERVGVVGPEPGLLLVWSAGSGSSGRR